jgi:hypothetical protein
MTEDCCHTPAPPKPARWKAYIPLIVIVSVTLLAAAAKQLHYGDAGSFKDAMHDWMGFFLLVFAMLKLFDLSGFAEGFQLYDLLAKRSRPYALLYPFLELALGLAFLSQWQPSTVYIATIVLLGFGSIGVLSALAKGLDVKCACMGSSLNVPLSTVAVIEDLGMAVMAFVMLLMS